MQKVGVEGEEIASLNKINLINLIDLMSKAATEIRTAVIEQLPLELAVIMWIGEQDPPQEPLKEEILSGPKTEITEAGGKDILAKIKPINTSIEALLRAARPLGLRGNLLELGVYYKFHKERLEEGKNRKVFEDVVETVMGTPIRVKCTLTEPPEKKVPLTENVGQDIIKAAEEIFGN